MRELMRSSSRSCASALRRWEIDDLFKREPDRAATVSWRRSSTTGAKQRDVIVKDQLDQIYNQERRGGAERLHHRGPAA